MERFLLDQQKNALPHDVEKLPKDHSFFGAFESDIHQRKSRPMANREIKSLPAIWSKAADRMS